MFFLAVHFWVTTHQLIHNLVHFQWATFPFYLKRPEKINSLTESLKHLCACVKKNVHSLKCGTDSNSVAASYKHHSILSGALLWDCVLIWDIWCQGQGKICGGLSFNISDGIFTHWGICCFTTIQLYTTGCFFLLTMSLFLFKCEKRNYNTNVLKLACFCTLMRICASEQLTQIPVSHCSYEPSQAEQHQIVSGMISSSYVTLVSKHWQSLAVWYHLCLDGYCKGEGCRLYLKANVL